MVLDDGGGVAFASLEEFAEVDVVACLGLGDLAEFAGGFAVVFEDEAFLEGCVVGDFGGGSCFEECFPVALEAGEGGVEDVCEGLLGVVSLVDGVEEFCEGAGAGFLVEVFHDGVDFGEG